MGGLPRCRHDRRAVVRGRFVERKSARRRFARHELRRRQLEERDLDGRADRRRQFRRRHHARRKAPGMRLRFLLAAYSSACGQERRHGFALLHLAWLAVLALALASPAYAEKGKLRERLTPEVMAVVYPGAEPLGPEAGSPPAIAAYHGDTP